ncbi:MAG TPA: hypothetical protein VNI83_11340 [Vicinamibacterales bacterium]|nr:hypothetical protein [Vicinamibacterales bacterium]
MDANVAREAIELIANGVGVDLALADGTLLVDGSAIALPADAGGWSPLAMRHALPSIAHGDAREKLLYTIVQDARVHPGTRSGLPPLLDAQLRADLAETVPLPEPDRQIVAEAMRDAYWVTPQKRPYLVPYQSLLPTSFVHATESPSRPGHYRAARYKLFRGVILLFLCWTGQDVDEGLVQELLDVMNGTDGFTVIDELLLKAARAAGADGGDALIDDLARHGASLPEDLADGAFCQPALDRFQRDLRTVLTMRRLPRRDLLDVLTALFSLHLAIYYYRLAVVLGEELDRAVAATGELAPPASARGCDCSGGLGACALAGRIRFRVGTSGDRPVSMRDGCATAYRDVDATRLLPLAATIITANLAQTIWHGLGGPAGKPRLRELTDAARADAGFARKFNAAAAVFAALHALETEQAATAEEAAAAGLRPPGLFALRESVLASRRSRLKYQSRDVVNQLAKREGGGSLIRTRGRVTFFELDEDFLWLLVRLVCGEREVSFTAFVTGLRAYGLAPQDGGEEVRLANALEHLGMLRRYSDAGESVYVHHNL